jgi:hypothetical protein
MPLPLPPKRFQPIDSTEYDQIRGRQWFAKLDKRRQQIPLLEQANKVHIEDGSILTQAQAAEMFNVDERELRDYEKFINGQSSMGDMSPSEKKVYQHILDCAYSMYDRFRAGDHIRTYIDSQARMYGVDGRKVIEMWEIDPTFYPTGTK